MQIAIIGGGAAGFFMAIHLKKGLPESQVTIYEKRNKVLSKVAVSGGGRCNLTNSFENVKDLKTVYPRGHKLLKRLFNIFDHCDAYAWFENHGVRLTTQDDQCVFPQSQNAMSVVNCLQNEAALLGVSVRTSHSVSSISRCHESGKYIISFAEEHLHNAEADIIAVTTGGHPRKEDFMGLKALGHQIETPIPSLFTFNIKDSRITQLSGLVIDPACVMIPGTKHKSEGALLITHWGMSGPAILKLSSHAARDVYQKEYRFTLSVNWADESPDSVTDSLQDIIRNYGNKQLNNIRPYNLPSRLWTFLLDKYAIPEDKKWNQLSKKEFNVLVNTLSNDHYQVDGKGAFKEEFVTCGGISLSAVHPQTLESKTSEGLYFAGEVLDIDAVTGGFNFQAAWTTAFTVSKAILEKQRNQNQPPA